MPHPRRHRRGSQPADRILTWSPRSRGALIGAGPTGLTGATLLLALAGLAVSGYLGYEHLTASTSLACPDTAAISCLKVTTSRYSSLVGVPVAYLGFAFFLAMSVLTLPRLWASPHRPVRNARLAAATIGILFVLYLVWAELFGVAAICLWCTAVHVITLALFTCVLGAEALRSP